MKNEAFNILFSQIKEGTVGIEAKMFYKGCFISSGPCFNSKREQLWTTFACFSAKCTGWTGYRLCCTAIVLTLHRWNTLIIFKQLSILPFLQEDFRVYDMFCLFSISKNGEHTFR